MFVLFVEMMCDDMGLFDVGKLIMFDGNKVCFIEEDVSGLMYREGEYEIGYWMF